jgi:hypothetical protein
MKLLFFTIVTIIFISCNTCNDKNNFSGNWYTCGKDGNYYELLIKDHVFKYSTKNGLITEWYEFKISDDTLIYNDPYLHKDSVLIIRSKISFINKDEMELDFTTSDEKWIFYRINETINDIDNNEKLLTGTKQRAEKAGCTDKRSEEEKQQDSLMKKNDFQF